MSSKQHSSNSTVKPISNVESVSDDEDIIDPLPTDLHEPITKNGTYIDLSNREFDYNPVGNRPPKYKRLELMNRGIYNGKWADQGKKRDQDDRYLCYCIASQTGLSHLKESVWKAYKPLDGRSFKKYENSNEGMMKQYLVVFCICALLYNKYQPKKKLRYYPAKTYEKEDKFAADCRKASDYTDEPLRDSCELLNTFVEDLGFSNSTVQSCIEKVRSKSDYIRNTASS